MFSSWYRGPTKTQAKLNYRWMEALVILVLPWTCLRRLIDQLQLGNPVLMHFWSSTNLSANASMLNKLHISIWNGTKLLIPQKVAFIKEANGITNSQSPKLHIDCNKSNDSDFLRPPGRFSRLFPSENCRIATGQNSVKMAQAKATSLLIYLRDDPEDIFINRIRDVEKQPSGDKYWQK